MNITLSNIGKRFNYEWIFRKIDHELTSAHNYVILGANGSGKSTLLQVIAGNIIPSEGEIKYQVSGSKNQMMDSILVSEDNIFKHLSFASPYLELFEEFTLSESIDFQSKFKPFYKGLSTQNIIEIIQLEKAKDKQLKYFSSGMKQRVRLALAILAETPLLLLDEPVSNLDKSAINWYGKLVKEYSADRLIIVCSNQQDAEYEFCDKQINIDTYK